MMARWGGAMIPRHYEALAGLAGQPDSVLVANPGVLAARLVQEKLGVPTASLLLQPGLLPSCTAPPEMPGGLTMPSERSRRCASTVKPPTATRVQTCGASLEGPSMWPNKVAA